ncbi:MAG: YcxB family protein [Lachnospiraceae bacterium]|nr:YcxB family protein [Lachnospiraceae bacterium]MDY5742058.1 YcxB family protein [Lachnospiraceae bacterium]
MEFEIKTVLTEPLVREAYRRLARRSRVLSGLYALLSMAYIYMAWRQHQPDRWLQMLAGVIGILIGILIFSGLWRWQAHRDSRLLSAENDTTVKLLFVSQESVVQADQKGQGICVYRPMGKERICYSYRQVKRVLELKHGFVLELAGGRMLIAEKAGFIKGRSERFVDWIKLQKQMAGK